MPRKLRVAILLLLHAPWARAPAAAQGKLTGKALYDALYSTGWGKDTRVSQGRSLRNTIIQMHDRRGAQVNSVLDVGCSHGDVVASLWERGIVASGVDIADGAAALATKLHKHPSGPAGCNSEGQPCFQAASATALPFASQSFDAISSSDVLEHLDPSEVRAATAEFARVARHFLVLKIADRNEHSTLKGSRAGVGEFRGQTFESILNRQGFVGRLPDQLHTVVRGTDFWHAEFSRVGFALNQTIDVGGKWACCAYVLHRVRSSS